MGRSPTEQGWRPGCGGTSSSAQHVAVQVRLRPETLELSGERPPFLGLDPSGPWLGLKEDTGPAATGVWGPGGRGYGGTSRGWPVYRRTDFPSACFVCPPRKTARTVGLSLLRLPQGLARGGLIITLLGQPPAGPPAKQSGLRGALQDRGKPADSSPTLGLSSHGPHTLGQWETQPQTSEPAARAPSLAPAAAAATGLVFPVLVRCVKEKAGAHGPPGTDGACQLPEILSPHAAGTACPLPSPACPPGSPPGAGGPSEAPSPH